MAICAGGEGPTTRYIVRGCRDCHVSQEGRRCEEETVFGKGASTQGDEVLRKARSRANDSSSFLGKSIESSAPGRKQVSGHVTLQATEGQRRQSLVDGTHCAS